MLIKCFSGIYKVLKASNKKKEKNKIPRPKSSKCAFVEWNNLIWRAPFSKFYSLIL